MPGFSMPYTFNRKPGGLLVSGVVLLFAVILSQLILAQLFSVALLFCLLPLFIFLSFRASYETRIFFALMTIGFPLTIPLLGKDGGTSTTFLIFYIVFLSAIEVFGARKSLTFRPIEKAAFLLILLGAFSFWGIPSGTIVQAVRYFYIFLSSVFIFLLIVKMPAETPEEIHRFVERLLVIMIVVVTVQVVIGLLIHYKPSMLSHFQIFLKGEENLSDAFAQAQKETGFVRFRTLITAPESTGEILAVCAPLVLYKYFSTRNPLYLAVFAFWGCGELMTATRSTTFIFCAASFLTILAYSRYVSFPKGMSVLMLIVFMFALLLLFFPGILTGIVHRVTLTEDAARQGGGITSVLNRDTVWEDALDNIRNSTLVGRGFLPPSRYLGEAQNFHCLYLTVFYQMGWLGTPVFCFVLLSIFIQLIFRFFREASAELKFLIFSCAVSMGFFLINQIKYEFNRHPPYQQFCWALFAVFYLVAHSADQKKKQIAS